MIGRRVRFETVRATSPFPLANNLVGVPPVLLKGNHAEINKWRRQRMLEATARKRPDLLARAREAGVLTKADEKFLAGL